MMPKFAIKMTRAEQEKKNKKNPQRTIWSISVLFVVPLENARCPPLLLLPPPPNHRNLKQF